MLFIFFIQLITQYADNILYKFLQQFLDFWTQIYWILFIFFSLMFSFFLSLKYNGLNMYYIDLLKMYYHPKSLLLIILWCWEQCRDDVVRSTEHMIDRNMSRGFVLVSASSRLCCVEVRRPLVVKQNNLQIHCLQIILLCTTFYTLYLL